MGGWIGWALLVCLPCSIAGARDTAARHIWKLSFQIGYDRDAAAYRSYAPLWKNDYARQSAFTRYVLDHIAGVALAETHRRKIHLIYGPGGYKRNPLASSAQLDVEATREEAITLERVIGYLARQYEVIASRPDLSGNRAAFQIVDAGGRTFGDVALLQRFWNRLVELSSRLGQGFLPLEVGGRRAIRIINTEETWTDADYPAFEQVISTLQAEFGASLVTERQQVDFEAVINDWRAHPDGSEYLTKLREQGQTALAERLQQKYRPMVEAWLAAAFKRYGSSASTLQVHSRQCL